VVEALGQTLGALGGLVLEAGGHRARDGQELGLDAPSDAAAPALELCLQASDRPLKARHGVALTRLPPVRELDDLTHDAIVEPPSDISSEPHGRPAGHSVDTDEGVFAMRALPGRYLFALTLVALAVAIPSPATAGGWDGLDFPKDHYLVGGPPASTTGSFYVGELEGSGPIDGRTYFAYLLPRKATESGFGMIDPPEIPEGAIRLGTLEITGPIEIERYVGPYARASLAFTIPDVPTGDYAIGFCDDPCVHGTVGWLAWGRIRIVHTEAEGRFLSQLDRQEIRSYRMRSDLRQATRGLEDLTTEIDDVRAKLRLERADATTPSERTITVQAKGDRRGAMWLIAALFVGLVVGAAAGVATARRRRAPAFVVPDTIPEDLDTRAPALRN
jgi:hypothetical protein